LHRLVEGIAAQAEMVRSQRDEPEALTDEVVARTTIPGASSRGERALTIRLERRF
jgi:hypothetical protein